MQHEFIGSRLPYFYSILSSFYNTKPDILASTIKNNNNLLESLLLPHHKKMENVVNEFGSNNEKILDPIEQYQQSIRLGELKREFHNNRINYTDLQKFTSDRKFIKSLSRNENKLSKHIDEMVEEQLLIMSTTEI